MTVYVDNMQVKASVKNGNRVVTGHWSHLMADTHDELVSFATKLGLNLAWIQHEGTPLEHFDVVESKRKKAIKLGAKQITWREGAKLTQRKVQEHAVE